MPVALSISATVSAFVISALLAWWRGSPADRLVAAGFLADTLLSLMLNDRRWVHVQIPSLVIDAVLLAVLVPISIRWPAGDRFVLTALQASLVSVHLARTLPSFDLGGGYAVATALLTYLQALLLLVAMVVRAARAGRASARSS